MVRPSPAARARAAAPARLVAALAATATLGAVLSAAPAQAAPDTCPDPTGAANVSAGDAVTGRTVTQGTTPTGFTGSILGVLDNGIAPGIPLIMARLTSPEIDRVGIWQGMSGSPVYASDGSLIGAVSYGLSLGPSPVAGITPAEDMETLAAKKVATSPAKSTGTPTAADLPTRLQRAAVAAGASPAEADSGLSPLRTPFTLTTSGSRAKVDRLTPHLRLGATVRRLGASTGGARNPGAVGDPNTIVPGGNMGASMSYGDVSAAGFGTVTAICNGTVIAFGHPFNLTGPARMTLHTASALYVQEDPAWAPFVVSNLTGRVGSITHDGLTGIAGPLGPLPKTVPVTSTFTGPSGTRTGSTHVTDPEWYTDLASTHVLTDAVRAMDGEGKGAGTFRYRVTGKRGDGRAFTLSRTDAIADEFDVEYAAAARVLGILAQLQYNGAENITFTGTRTWSTLSTRYGVYRVKGIQRRSSTGWHELSLSRVLTVRAGSVQHLRARLVSKDLPTRTVAWDVSIPKKAAGRTGAVRFTGGSSASVPPARGGNVVDRVLADTRRAPHTGRVYRDFRILGGAGAVHRRSSAAVGKVTGGTSQLTLRVIR